jgi:hypothetical protein
VRFLIILVMQLAGIAQFVHPSLVDGKAIEVEETYHKHTKGPDPILVLRIWLPEQEPTKANFLEVCKLLKLKYKNESRIEANIFSSEEGAKGFSELYEFAGYKEYYSTWRAKYWLDRKTGKEWLDYCEGSHDKERNPFIHIDLSTSIK